MDIEQSTLYVVSTPIGNLGDITQRALDVLAGVDAILAEDTRRTAQLLSHYNIKSKLVSFHDHNERERVEQIVQWLSEGQSLALVSDAGTPLISDPGYVLVSELRTKNIKVSPIPGVSAIVTALSASGLPTDRFCFEGFLPAKPTQRRNALERVVKEPRTLVFYESSHRIEDSIADCVSVFGGERKAVIARELTKRFETFLSGSLESILIKLQTDSNQQKGEFVVMIAGAELQQHAFDEKAEMLAKELVEHLPPKLAAQIISNLTELNKKQAYELILSAKGNV